MQIVIELPQKLCNEIKQSYSIKLDDKSTDKIIKAISNGTVLPEQHGDLIDINDIQEITLEDSLHIITYKKGNGVEYEIDAPTILEGTVIE